MTLPIAITMGDPSGVGPELVARILEAFPEWRKQVCVIGAESWASDLCQRYGVDYAVAAGVKVCDPGNPSVAGAATALEAMKIAATGCVEGRYSSVVTGPISKYWCQQAGMQHPGQTEFFAEQWGGKPTMAFVANNMVVSLATWHIPLMSVASVLTKTVLFRCLDHTAGLLKQLGFSIPKIGVCGLNPHAGEEGQIGREELETLNPFLKEWRIANSGTVVSDCLPADTLFYRHLTGEFDGVVALYHDQALGPVKTVAFHDAVNVTWGLPFVRTSPDHGTAFDIAGRGLAKTGSMLSAMKLAAKLCHYPV